jgi:hypothetical protein
MGARASIDEPGMPVAEAENDNRNRKVAKGDPGACA